MSPNAIAIERCAHCGTEFPGSKLFCTGCGKPNRNRASGPEFLNTAAPPPRTFARPATVQPPPMRAAGPVTQSSNKSGSYASPLPASAVSAGVEEPMSWEMLLIWSFLSLGIVTVVYAFKQTMWAKRMDPRSTATARLAASYLLPLGGVALIAARMVDPRAQPLTVIGVLLLLATPVIGVLYAITMTQTLRAVANFNAVPLRPKTVLGVFFNLFYFQHCIRVIELHCSAVQNP